jgi:hypothetical protein
MAVGDRVGLELGGDSGCFANGGDGWFDNV